MVSNHRQHPLPFCKPSDRFIIMLQVGSIRGAGFNGPAFEPLAYGLEGQPAPEQLLRRGCRAASFPTEDAAREALHASAELWKRDGLTFHIGKQVEIVKVEIAP
jgi:hypothetical protein